MNRFSGSSPARAQRVGSFVFRLPPTHGTHEDADHTVDSPAVSSATATPRSSLSGQATGRRCFHRGWDVNRAPYELALESRVPDGPSIYEFDTADGVCAKHSFRGAELTLIEGLWDEPLGDLCCLEANYGAVVLAARAASVEMVESSARARELCRTDGRSPDRPPSRRRHRRTLFRVPDGRTAANGREVRRGGALELNAPDQSVRDRPTVFTQDESHRERRD